MPDSILLEPGKLDDAEWEDTRAASKGRRFRSLRAASPLTPEGSALSHTDHLTSDRLSPRRGSLPFSGSILRLVDKPPRINRDHYWKHETDGGRVTTQPEVRATRM